MKRVLRRSITAADDTVNEALDNAISTLKDDFDYAISGLEKLGRNGANAGNQAMAIAETLSNDIQSTLDQIANFVISEE